MPGRRKFTLLELLVVLFIMVIAGALIIGRLSRLPRAAVMGEVSGRIDGLCRFASEAAMICNRPVELIYRAGSRTVEIATQLVLDEPDYGKVTTSGRFKTRDGEAFGPAEVPVPRHRSRLTLPAGYELTPEPAGLTLEDVIKKPAAVRLASEPEPEEWTMATFYPDGAADGRRWKLHGGDGAARYAELSKFGGALIIGDAPVTAWNEAGEN